MNADRSVSETAITAAYVEAAYGVYADGAGGTIERALAAAYPIIRADVIAENAAPITVELRDDDGSIEMLSLQAWAESVESRLRALEEKDRV